MTNIKVYILNDVFIVHFCYHSSSNIHNHADYFICFFLHVTLTITVCRSHNMMINCTFPRCGSNKGILIDVHFSINRFSHLYSGGNKQSASTQEPYSTLVLTLSGL